MKFYISDLHLDHRNVIRYDNRPFSDLNDMRDTILRNWNSVVTPEDEVYILGDFAWKNTVGEQVLPQLCGRKFLILGNHDHPSEQMCSMFEWVRNYSVLNDEERQVVLCHYPIANWYRMFRGSYHLYGHVHNNDDGGLYLQYLAMLRAQDIPANACNVGCMLPYMNYTPRTLTEILLSDKET